MDVYKWNSDKQSKNPAYYWRFYFTREGSLLSNLELGEKEHVQENLWEPCCSCRKPGRVAMGAVAHKSCTQLSGFLLKGEAQRHHLPLLQPGGPAFTLCLARLFTHQTFHWAVSWVESIQHRLRWCSASGRGEGGVWGSTGGWRVEEGQGGGHHVT